MQRRSIAYENDNFLYGSDADGYSADLPLRALRQDVYMTYPLRTEYGWASPGSAVANSTLKKQFEQAAGNTIIRKDG